MRYCLYCRRDKPAKGFIQVLHPGSQTYRGQCTDCQAVRRKSREELEAMAEKERNERKKR